VLATCMAKPTWIVVSSDPDFYGRRPVRYGNFMHEEMMKYCTSAGSNDSYVALSQHLLSFLSFFRVERSEQLQF